MLSTELRTVRFPLSRGWTSDVRGYDPESVYGFISECVDVLAAVERGQATPEGFADRIARHEFPRVKVWQRGCDALAVDQALDDVTQTLQSRG